MIKFYFGSLIKNFIILNLYHQLSDNMSLYKLIFLTLLTIVVSHYHLNDDRDSKQKFQYIKDSKQQKNLLGIHKKI